jgi:hypothetical protein
MNAGHIASALLTLVNITENRVHMHRRIPSSIPVFAVSKTIPASCYVHFCHAEYVIGLHGDFCEKIPCFEATGAERYLTPAMRLNDADFGHRGVSVRTFIQLKLWYLLFLDT